MPCSCLPPNSNWLSDSKEGVLPKYPGTLEVLPIVAKFPENSVDNTEDMERFGPDKNFPASRGGPAEYCI